MYHAFYHLHTDPFRLTPDPAFCFPHERYARALTYMQYALRQGEGFIMVTGLPGTGKTTLVEQFHSKLNGSRTLVARLDSTQVQAEELLRLTCLSLGVSIEAADKASVLHRLREFFMQQASKGRRVLLLIDEAQGLPLQSLEELRLLGNLQLNARPLLQIFLVGQQQLLDMVQLPAMRPLYQRLVAACHLEPLNLEVTRAYIEYRLKRAGWSGEPTFDEGSYRMIHRFTDGFPRQINKLCSRLLLYGSVEQKRSLDCFDCITVLRHWVEELPGSTFESSFQACVDMLNTSWSDAQGGDAVAEAAVPRAMREPAPSDAGQAAAQAPAESEADLLRADDRYTSVVKAQVASTGGSPSLAPVTDALDVAARTTRAADADSSPEGRTATDAAFDLQPALPARILTLTRTRSCRATRQLQFTTSLELLRNRTVRRASAPLGLLVALLVGVLFLAGAEQDDGSANTTAASNAPEVAGATPVVATLAPQSPPALQRSETVPDPINHDENADRRAVVPMVLQSDTELAEGASEPAHPAIEPAPFAGASLAAAAAAPGSPEESMQPETAVELHDNAPEAEHTATSGALAAVELKAIASPTEPRGDKQNDTVEAVADPEVAAANAEQQRINDLMISAAQALRENRLTVPPGNNAYHYYREVLSLQPRHDGARTGMQRVAERYRRLTERALAHDNIRTARRYVARGLMVSPGNRQLLALQQDVNARELWLETEAALAAAEAEARHVEPPPPKTKPRERFLDKVKAFFSNPVPPGMP
jgi:type II secretory pathway predicted ATPase ExeA